MLLFEFELLPADFFDQRGIVFAHLFLHAQFFELHVQLENFFQQIGRNDLLF